jgi:hypothetical protein
VPIDVEREERIEMADQSAKKRGAERRRERKTARRAARPVDRLPFERANWILFGVALAVIALGYVFLAAGSITLAPLLLVAGYCVLVPLAIIYKPRPRVGQSAQETGE